MAGVEWQRRSSMPDWQRLVQVLTFAGLGVYLILGSRRDARARNLGAFFLLVAVFFSHSAIDVLVQNLPAQAAALARLTRATTVDAFLATMGWLLLRDFPRALEWPRTASVIRGVIGASGVIAVGLIAANVALALEVEAPFLENFDRVNPASLYTAIVFGALLPTPFAMYWRSRYAPQDERRRLRLFTGGVVLAGAPLIVLSILPALSPSLEAYFRQEPGGTILRNFFTASIMTMAGTMTYAIVVQRVFDVRTVLRRAAQYALARLGVAVLAGAPFGALVVLLIDESLSSLVEGPRLLIALALLGAGIAVVYLRRPVMSAIDHFFFRESYDAPRILAAMADHGRRASSIGEFATSLAATVDDALHVESSAVLTLDEHQHEFVPRCGGARRLPGASLLLDEFVESDATLLIDFSSANSPLRELPESDRMWLSDGGFELLVALRGSGEAIIGLLALGPKRSELPFSREDLLLLSGVAGTAGIALANRLLQMHTEEPETLDRVSQECEACGIVQPARGSCDACGGRTRGSRLPHELAGKFRIEQRIGVGAMGVVYRGTDLTLGREVALKTLPETSPEDAFRLRREARAMASITHPNLALIFGAESFLGTPILVIEYLPGGTLTDRLADGPLAPLAGLELCALLADVLDCAHSAGILHRDVKPSNVAFTETGIPKLLDFGLVRIAGEASPMSRAASDLAASETGVVGTPLYMSPEALSGAKPDPTFDLWGLSVLAFEAVSGRHPFEYESPQRTLDAIRTGKPLDLRELRPELPEAFTTLFGRLLAKDQARRPSTATSLAQVLRATAEDVSSRAAA
jgi:hypothetical protein